jgi:UDP-N-acetylmuramoyl-L-alanyl-D-glutamate--2,6-diaminopimelate ligase
MDNILNKLKRYIPKRLFKALQPAYHYSMSALAAAWYRWPSDKLIIIGITGTTGKTTSAYLILKVLEAAGFKAGMTSTAIFADGEREWLNDKKMTMVGRFFTQRMIAHMVRNKCQFGIIETTSEGIAQYRHKFINYDILAFTGLYPEHIESHGSFDKYKKAKGRLFEHLKSCKTKYSDDTKKIHHRISNLRKIELDRIRKTIVANLDDENAGYFLDFWAEEKMGVMDSKQNEGKNSSGWSQKSVKVMEYGDVDAQNTGTSFKLEGKKINLQLLGVYSAVNAMMAAAVARTQDIGLEKIKAGLESVSGIAGRFERIDEGQTYTVIVDYAFEPNAVNKLYDTLKLIPHGKVIHVLGSAGGGRDIARRPKLGQIAGRNADVVIVTNEDPYDDDPALIMDQVAIGVEQAGKSIGENFFKILDRRAAIEKALSMAAEGDMVLVTGKGSEQAIASAHGENIPWDDRAVIRGLLNGKK